MSGLALVLVIAGATASGSTPPNILLIIADDHHWADYSFQGHAQLRTPHIDRLAREGLCYPRGYVPSSLCCPSLASILTGLYPHQHRVTSNDPPHPPSVEPADFHASQAFRGGRARMIAHLERVPTLPSLLATRGYRSLQTGKWWHGHYRHGGFTDGMTEGERHGDRGLVIGRSTLQPIFDFVDECRGAQQPFFIWYAPMMPHQPHDPPERWMARYQDQAPSSAVARYWAMVAWFDETVGQLLDHLDRRDLAEDTIVVYLADNGWLQRVDGEGYAPRSKQSPYEGGLRTPLLIRWPGHVAPRRDEKPVLSIDIAPTLLRAVGLEIPREMPGVDLLDADAVAQRPAIAGACFTHHAIDLDDPAANLRWRWILAGDWKLIVPDARNEPDAAVELYRVTSDPAETQDRAAHEPHRVAELSAALDRWWQPQRRP